MILRGSKTLTSFGRRFLKVFNNSETQERFEVLSQIDLAILLM